VAPSLLQTAQLASTRHFEPLGRRFVRFHFGHGFPPSDLACWQTRDLTLLPPSWDSNTLKNPRLHHIGTASAEDFRLKPCTPLCLCGEVGDFSDDLLAAIPSLLTPSPLSLPTLGLAQSNAALLAFRDKKAFLPYCTQDPRTLHLFAKPLQESILRLALL
jgi:hypothetical protein